MKHTFIILILMLPTILFAQHLKIDKETGRFTKEGIVGIENMSKKAIYKKAVEWVAMNYKSANDVIQLKDEESGKVIIKGAFQTSMYMKKGLIRHTLTLKFKDNKFKYSYTYLSYYSRDSGEFPFEKKMISFKKKLISSTEDKIDNSIKSLTEYIIKSQDTDDDW